MLKITSGKQHDVTSLSRLSPDSKLAVALLKRSGSLAPLLRQLQVARPGVLIIAANAEMYALTQADVQLACSAASSQLLVYNGSDVQLPDPPAVPGIVYQGPVVSLVSLMELLHAASEGTYLDSTETGSHPILI